MSRISIVIPVHNKWDLTVNCLRSLAEFSVGVDLQIIVADNASSDQTATELLPLGQSLFADNFVLLRFEQNINYGPACNAGSEKADGEFLFLLNNDTRLTTDWLPPLVSELERPLTAGVGPVLTYEDHKVQHLGICIPCLGNKLSHLYTGISADHPLAKKRRSFPAITAAALLLPLRDFHEAGGFFPDFVNGFEDVDLCLRLTKDGNLMRITPESRFFHLEGQSENRHNAEKHNGELLTSRWKLYEYENMTRIAAQDGYEIQIDPVYGAVFVLPEARKLDLLKLAKSNNSSLSLQSLYDLLECEPLWEDGYLLLTDALAAVGELEEAIRVCNTGFNFVGTFPCLEKAYELAGQVPLESEFGQCLSMIRQRYLEGKTLILDHVSFKTRMRYYKEIMQRVDNTSLLKALTLCELKAQKMRATWQQ